MIESNHCSFRYQNTDTYVLEDINLSIHPGECVVLCGKSGCGKTSLTRLINGLSPSFFSGELTGSCNTLGLETGISAIEEYVPIVGSVFQNPKTQHFNVDTTAELAFPCENMGIPSEDIQKRVHECASTYGLEHLLDRSIFKLSGGEKQRIAFGTACMLNPKLLVLDEPTSGLDYYHMTQVAQLLNQLKEHGAAVLVITHDEELASGWCDKVIYLEEKENSNGI